MVHLKLSEGYRSARRNLTVICAVALAWASTQIELRFVKSELLGELDLSNAAIPLLLLAALLYVCTRGAVEFGMQSVETRRWGYAQADVKLSVWLVRATLVALAASGLERSLRAIAAMIVVSLAGAILAAALAVLLMFALTPLLMRRTEKRGGRPAVAAHVMGAFAIGAFVAVVVLALAPFAVVASIHWVPGMQSFLGQPTWAGSVVFSVATVALIFSFAYQRWWSDKLFAAPPYEQVEEGPSGRRYVTFLNDRPKTVWDWAESVEPPARPRRLSKKRN